MQTKITPMSINLTHLLYVLFYFPTCVFNLEISASACAILTTTVVSIYIYKNNHLKQRRPTSSITYLKDFLTRFLRCFNYFINTRQTQQQLQDFIIVMWVIGKTLLPAQYLKNFVQLKKTLSFKRWI